MTSVNSVLTFASVPALPFGGVGDSGFGRIHGEDGLQGVHPGQGDHPPAGRAAGEPDELRPAGGGHRRLARVMGLIHGRHR